MNTQSKSKPAKDQGKSAVEKKAPKAEDQKSCKDGVCELSWKPTRPHAA